MSRIGKLPISVPSDVQVTIQGHSVTFKGPKGTLSVTVSPSVQVKHEGAQLLVLRTAQDETGALHGLTRALLNNMVIGVTKGFEKKLELSGVGFRAQVQGKKLNLSIGYTHPVVVQAPDNITFEVAENVITVKGLDKQLVGEVAAEIRSYYVPEPYKGKGIKYAGEHVFRKEGKRVAAAGSA